MPEPVLDALVCQLARNQMCYVSRDGFSSEEVNACVLAVQGSRTSCLPQTESWPPCLTQNR